jgi:cell division protein FtsL
MLLAEERSLAYQASPITGTSKSPLPNRRQQMKKISRILGVLLCLIAVNMIFQALVVQQNNQIKVWQVKIRDLEREKIQLRVEMAYLESFDRIQYVAQTKLGMRAPGSRDFRCIAAAPVERPRLYTKTQPSSKTNRPWGKVTTWLGGMGKTMAQTP